MNPAKETDFFSLPRPRAIAHRGSSGTHPENTMVSFRAAYDADAKYFELDVHMTRDGQVVISHDPELSRTSGRSVEIRTMSYNELAGIDAGWGFTASDGGRPFAGKGIGVPRLVDVLSAFNDVRFVIEIKQTEPSLAAALLRVIKETGMERQVIIASEHFEPLREFRQIAPGIPTSFCAGEIGAFVQALPTMMVGYVPPAAALQVPPSYEWFKIVTPESVAAAHELGLEVHVWTVNEEAEMHELLEMGVDGIISDFPARLIGVTKQMSAVRH